MTDDRYYRDLADVIAEQQQLVPAPITDGVYADFAEAIVAAHNAEGRDLNAESFARATSRCDLSQRWMVARELPAWAQRNINLWEDAA